jgi:hypothetical protein
MYKMKKNFRIAPFFLKNKIKECIFVALNFTISLLKNKKRQ